MLQRRNRGTFDLDAELRSGCPAPLPITLPFNKKLGIYAVQSVLASYVLR